MLGVSNHPALLDNVFMPRCVYMVCVHAVVPEHTDGHISQLAVCRHKDTHAQPGSDDGGKKNPQRMEIMFTISVPWLEQGYIDIMNVLKIPFKV